jgi:hypothetical protein
MRNGDLTEAFFRRADGSLIPIQDLTGSAPFPNNQIPASRISTISRNLYAFYPMPNFNTANFNRSNNYSGASRDWQDDQQFFIRIDHSFNENNHLFGRYGYQDVQLPPSAQSPSLLRDAPPTPAAERHPQLHPHFFAHGPEPRQGLVQP